MAKTEKTYQELKDELDELMMWFGSEDIDLDEALRKYEQGMLLIKQLESQLKDAENKVVKLKEKFGE